MGMPALAAARTAASAPAASLPPWTCMPRLLVVMPQLGSPSVARRMYLGFGSVSVIKYAAPLMMALAVGVLPPGSGCAVASSVLTMVPLFAAGATATPAPTSHEPLMSSSGKYFRPQRIVPVVVPTTMLMPLTMSGHFGVHGCIAPDMGSVQDLSS